MFCEECKPEVFEQAWDYENGTYKALSNVFTLEILKEIIAHAKKENVQEIYVDTLTCETHGCEVCFLLHIRAQQERDEFLQQFDDDSINFYEML